MGVMSANLDLNLNALIRLFSKDRSMTASLGIFKGMASFTIFEAEKRGAPVLKSTLNPTTVEVLKGLIGKCLADPAFTPKTVEISTWVFDDRAFKYESSIQVGRNKEGVCFLRFMNDKHKDGIGFFTLSDPNVKIDGQLLPEKEMSELGMKTILTYLTNHLAVGTIVTKDKMPPPGGNGSGGGPAGGGSGGGNATGTDVPF